MNNYAERLPCGVQLEALLAQVADDQPAPDPTHQKSCPYCQATLRRLRQDWAEVQTLTQQRVSIPPGLTAKIMARVRVLAGHVSDSILLGYPGGETRISHDAIARVIARLTATIPGVVFATVKPLPEDPPHPIRLGVRLRLVVAFGPRITKTTNTVRDLLQRHVSRLTGAEITHIDITVSHITDPPDKTSAYIRR
jgi:uncharacterized alkaline shock family protein YloU